MKLNERLQSLSPEQRALFEKQLQEKGLAAKLKTQTAPTAPAAAPSHKRPRRTDKGMEFSLFFFSGNGSTDSDDKYGLLMNCARYADRNGFTAVWTPERHFEEFGGLYPNPAVLGAALAMETKHVQIRAGSVALPLHHPIRFVEEWSVVDNLSRGRAAVALATGWHPADFELAPERTHEYYENRKDLLFENIGKIRRLWAGEATSFRGVDGKEHEVVTLPRPVQKELGIWVASNGNLDTFARAGESGAHLLTSVLKSSNDEMARKIAVYREARARSGYDPETGKVTMMLHACLGETNAGVKELVRTPLQDYLHTFLLQQRNILDGYSEVAKQDWDELIAYSFDHYFAETALLGTVDKCAERVRDLIDIGVDEVACLVDFGIAENDVLAGLDYLTQLKNRFDGRS